MYNGVNILQWNESIKGELFTIYVKLWNFCFCHRPNSKEVKINPFIEINSVTCNKFSILCR